MGGLKKILPPWLKQLILTLIELPGRIFSPFFSKSKLLASLYYTFLNRKFSREHKAVLSGRVAYHQKLKHIGQSAILLRRNVHRLEKGLIMEPRRDTFAEGFIGETVKYYKLAVQSGDLSKEECKWFTDVLKEYFSVVKETNSILKARKVFDGCIIESTENESDKYIPYSYDSLLPTDISFEALNKLFLKRRSVRWYQDKPVPMELVRKAIDIATLAPSACNRQPYSFYASSSREKAFAMASIAGGTVGFSQNLPCVITIVGDLSAYPNERDRHLIYIDGSLVSMQLMLSLETLGLATCPINWPDIESAEKKMQNLLDLKDYERPVMLLAVGYAKDKGGIPYSQKKNASVLLKQI
jgi:nitroreductase